MKRQGLERTERLNEAAAKLYAPHLETRPGTVRAQLRDPENRMAWDEWEFDLRRKIEAGYPPAAILRDNKDNLAIFEQVDEMRWDSLMRALGARDDG